MNWNATKAEYEVAMQIAKRATQLAIAQGVIRTSQAGDFQRTTSMDIIAAHINGCPLKLDELLHAEGFDFVHDVWGIRRHIDRETGELQDCFLPRYSV